ncbi:MAG: hypothetical protein Tsb0014_21790 [Pleurocapsa sp.]
MKKQFSIYGQLERTVEKYIHSMLSKKIGHYPDKIICYLFSDKLVIVIENTLNQIEKFLIQGNQQQTVQQARSQIKETVKNELITPIETILKIDVVGFMLDTVLEPDYTRIVVLLSDVPQVNTSQSMPQLPKLTKLKV